MPTLANNLAVDMVHLSFPVPIRRRTLRCPVIVSPQGLNPYDDPDNFGFPKCFFNRVFLQRCLGEVDYIACVSETTLSKLKMRFPRFARRKALVINNCTTVQYSEPKQPSWGRCQFVMMVAQHRSNKNIYLALKVFEELLQSKEISQRAVLLLVGSQGSETSAIKSIIKLRKLEKNVRLMEKVSDGELRWLYQNCELLIAPSLEGVGLSVIEGLLCGSRVVCSDIPTFREIGGDACHYFDLHAQSAASAIIAAIRNALAEPARKAEGLERFSLENVAREYADVYSRLREDS